MIFEPMAEIYDLWVHKVTTKKEKSCAVSGRGFCSLSYRKSGVVRFRAGQQEFFSRGGSITFMPAGVSYETEVEEPTALTVIHFKTRAEYPALRPFCVDVHRDGKWQALFEALAAEKNGYRAMALTYSLLAELESPRRYAPKHILAAKEQMDTRFFETLRVEELAAEAGLSGVHFRNEFKRYFGVTPLAYLKRVRLEQAKQLLTSGYYTVTEAAAACGFDSVSYFSQEFRRMTGQSPRDYGNL